MNVPARQTLKDVLTFVPSGEDRWMVPSPGEGIPRLYGGQVAAQALAVSSATVPDGRSPHSVHCHFVRGGKPDADLELTVERTRDGRSFNTRRVTALQDGQPIMIFTTSFQVPEPGTDWQVDRPALVVPEEEPSTGKPSGFRAYWEQAPFEIRLEHPEAPGRPTHPVWVRAIEPLGSSPLMHACAVAFISDMNVPTTARSPEDHRTLAASTSLEHTVWFHRPSDMTQWHVSSAHPISNYGARGFALGSVHSADGTLVASFAQEALIRTV